MMSKQFSTPIKWASLSFCLSQLVACGGTEQDEGSVSSFQQEFRGLAIDGYLARSTVFLDTNNNGTRDPWEPFAFTDNEGYYSYNPNTDTDYCAATASAEQQQYCLRTNVERSNVVIRIDGGYDTLTGEPFTGQLSRRIDTTTSDLNSNAVISPITSLLTNVENAADRTSVLNAMNMTESDLDVNYLNIDNNGTINADLLNTALKVHKTVSVLSDRLTDHYTRIGEEVNMPNDASSTIYSHLAQAILSNNITNIDTALNDNTLLSTVLDNSGQQLQNFYVQKELNLPDTFSAESATRALEVGQGVASVVNALIPEEKTINTLSEARGIAKTLESVVIKSINEQGTDTTLDNAINLLTNPDNASLVDALTTAMSRETADVSMLSQHAFNAENLDTEEKILSATQLPADAVAFENIGGRQIRVSDLDLGSAPDNLKDSEIELYFNGETSDVSGSFMACLKYIDGANADGTLGEGNSRGEIVDGFWSLLGSSIANPRSYSLLITINFLGTTYQAIMKPAGVETVNEIEYERLRFDSDGDIGYWHSALGLQETGSAPTTNAECEQRLPSRVGI